MDPVYAGTIAGMAILFGGVLCGFTLYVYKECQTRRPLETDYTRV
jgi:hypothetical protein